jgi:uncharacterized protein YbaP (TraB family)
MACCAWCDTASTLRILGSIHTLKPGVAEEFLATIENHYQEADVLVMEADNRLQMEVLSNVGFDRLRSGGFPPDSILELHSFDDLS